MMVERIRWGHRSFPLFVTDVLGSCPTGNAITLRVVERKDVQTRRWWTLTWTATDDAEHTVEGYSMPVVLRKAQEVQDRIDHEEETRETPDGGVKAIS